MEDNEECVEKILKLLDEYNCKIEYDDELGMVICVDSDTNKFVNI
jgi:uncharacterized FlaG/YvyC family protein